MSFPKAKLKRFNDIAVFSSPFGGKRDNSASKKDEKSGSASDLDSVKSASKSSKSSAYRLFRTPSLPRRLKFRTNSESTPKKSTSSVKTNAGGIPLPPAIKQKESLEIATLELKEKCDKLIECEYLVAALKSKYEDILDENSALRKTVDELEMSNKLLQQVADGSVKKIEELEVERAIILRDYEMGVGELIRSNQQLQLDCQEKDEAVQFLQLETESFRVSLEQCEIRIGQFIDEAMDLRRENAVHKEEVQKLSSELTSAQNHGKQLTEEFSRARQIIAELTEELRDCQIELDNHDLRLKEVESVAVLERAKLLKSHVEQLAEVEREKLTDIDKINEAAEEKIRIAGLQAQEKIRGLQREIEVAVGRETSIWRSELDRCQKIAENEILQMEYEKRDLKTLLDDANELMREKDRRITELEHLLKEEDDTYAIARRDCEVEIKKTQEAYQKLMTEKHNYQLTLENTRSTVNILMERLKRSDTDVEVLNLEKSSMNCEIERLKEQILRTENEKEELRCALEALHKSSVALEVEMKAREALYEQLMTSEAETLVVVDNLGKLFQDRIDEGASKYAEMYSDLKKRYEMRESYIKDMKNLLEEFADGIELARIELDLKDQKLYDLEEENRTIKLESMTYKFKYQQFEAESDGHAGKSSGLRPPNPTPDPTREAPEGVESNQAIQELIDELQKEASPVVTRQICLLDDFASWNCADQGDENRILRQQLGEMVKKVEKLEAETQNSMPEKRFECYKEDNVILKQRICHLESVTKDQEVTINVLKDLIDLNTTTNSAPVTPHKPRRERNVQSGTPKTPKCLFMDGKENLSPASKVLRQRNN
ncbi:coiled-coil domain-containing protein 186 [Phlebotomus argentipes]|uniref:coiled-coil domain-containing protein 186 n=1 Tax=Phlebotomus argentipes TaxID=94469 RepID=UPI00289301D8|nr:coiled-coil domain-containing protein 186 [Phlebotomus argentipes]